MFLALFRKNPVLWISFSSCLIGTVTSAAGVEYFLNSSVVTILTRSSVHWADRIVAISNSNGVSWTRAQVASGYSCLSSTAALRARFLTATGAAGIAAPYRGRAGPHRGYRRADWIVP